MYSARSVIPDRRRGCISGPCRGPRASACRCATGRPRASVATFLQLLAVSASGPSLLVVSAAAPNVPVPPLTDVENVNGLPASSIQADQLAGRLLLQVTS
jgi:hypothetical protein